MSDHDALLLAIAEHPEEDTPRLMYADWLEENGEPERADFVRNQVELSRFRPGDPASRPLVRKNVAYLRDWVPLWKSQLPQLPGIEWGDFNRGLIEEVHATTTRAPDRSSESLLVRHAGEIFAVPGIHILRLSRLDNGRALARVPELIRVRKLRIIRARADAATLQALFASPHLARLSSIELDLNRADNAVAGDLADGRFPELIELCLSSNSIGDLGALALANSPHLNQLRLLDLGGNPIIDNATRNALRRRFGSAVKL